MSMTKEAVQRLLAAAGYYKGGIDGDIGEKSLTAIDKVLRNSGPPEAIKWAQYRRVTAAAQLILNAAGYNAGDVDGYAGHNTIEALRAWEYEQVNKRREVVDRTPAPGYVPAKGAFPAQAQCATFYGTPGDAIKRQLVTIEMPIAFRIDYALHQKTKSFVFHKKCADSAKAVWEQVIRHYGETRLRALGLDRQAGTYNHRLMRGGTAWSMHAYGCAQDVYAAPNGLRVRCPKALFCGEDYKAFFDIWEAHGWTSLGRAIGRDWMHVQAARL